MSLSDGNDHARRVEEWMERAAGQPPERLPDLADQALRALWQRAQVPLGDVTLTAIVDRVLHDVTERFPRLAPLRLEATGISCQGLIGTALPEAELREGLRFLLVHLLTVLGELTAEILTPALHSALARSAPAGPAAPGAEDAPEDRGRDGGEKAES